MFLGKNDVLRLILKLKNHYLKSKTFENRIFKFVTGLIKDFIDSVLSSSSLINSNFCLILNFPRSCCPFTRSLTRSLRILLVYYPAHLLRREIIVVKSNVRIYRGVILIYHPIYKEVFLRMYFSDNFLVLKIPLLYSVRDP